MADEATAHADGQTAPVSGPLQKVPIVVVPGIMGTRLQDGNSLTWNPRGQATPLLSQFVSGKDPGDLTCDVARLQDPTALAPSTLGYDKNHPDFARAQNIVNFSHLIADFYGDLLFKLSEDLRMALVPFAKEPRVYACGYDWRRDNMISAGQLSTVVETALSDCNADKVILVAHSQGGLVSRYYCKCLGGEQKLLALFLIGSPSVGAPAPYAWLKNGMPASHVDDLFIRLCLLGKLTEPGSRDILRGFPSGYQLCPSLAYTAADPGWITFVPSNTGLQGWDTQFSDASSPYLYTNSYTGFCETLTERTKTLPKITAAAEFHAKLVDGGAVYMPAKTYAIVTPDMDTGTKIDLPVNPLTRPPQSWGGDPNAGTGGAPTTTPALDTHAELSTAAAGDGSVPKVSSTAVSPATPFVETKVLSGVKHGAMAQDPACTAYLVNTIPNLFSAPKPAGQTP